MTENVRVAVTLSPEILSQLESEAITIEDELRRKDSTVYITYEGTGGTTKDLAMVITASAGLAPLLVPILTSLFKRLFPLREIILEEESLPDGTQRRKFSLKER